MAPRAKVSPFSWAPFVWTVVAAVIGVIFSIGGFYATITGTLNRHNEAITELTKVLKEENSSRIAMEKNEANNREKLRAEYLGLMKDQTVVFTGMADKMSSLITKVEVMGTRYEKINEDVKKVLENTSPVPTGSTRDRPVRTYR